MFSGCGFRRVTGGVRNRIYPYYTGGESDTPPSVDTPPSPSKSKSKRSIRRKKNIEVENDEGGGGPTHTTGRKGVLPPPPPQRRRTQPEFMKELAAEMKGRRNREDTPPIAIRGGVVTGHPISSESVDEEENISPVEQTDGGEGGGGESNQIGSPVRSRGTKGAILKPRTRPAPLPPSSKAPPTTEEGVSASKGKSLPPPVSSKPKKVVSGNAGFDEPDSATPLVMSGEPEANNEALIKQSMVDKEEAITMALKEQAGNQPGK